ncbi:MAG: S8 family serine peptidase, partial [Myxococcota bacterium]
VVVDDGVDDGTVTPYTDEFYVSGDESLASRIVFSVLPPGSSGPSPSGPDGHGHINASIVGGYNSLTGSDFEDTSGFNYALGVSPYGRMANVRIFVPGFDTGSGDATMVDDYYQRGGRVSTNSWGADVYGDYDTYSQMYDGLVRDARSSVAGNQELLFIFANGNAGPNNGSVGSPATAKNVLSVGASETSNPDAVNGDGCGSSLNDGDKAQDMADFSSRGPCDDGRIKPEIVAPGTFIQGNASQPDFNGSGVCGASANNFSAPGDDALFPAGSIYTWSSGTSHSTPGIAGYTSLITEFVDRVYEMPSPSPALVKAYVVHSGRQMTGVGANEDLPGNNQGFGIADMGAGFNTSAPRLLADQTTLFGASGESTTLFGQIVDPSEEVRIALVWTDAPGAAFSDAYVNDLDLVVEIGSTIYRGNNFTLGISQPGGTADFRNNSEAVFLAPGPSGSASITINAITIAGDGVPGNADTTDQDFALVAYNFSTTVSDGTIGLNRERYGCTDTVGIAVSDSDLSGGAPFDVAVATSGGDSETVTLSENSAGSGVFQGSIDTGTGSVLAADGTLTVLNGETITATYVDADDGTGSSAVKEATAAIDCTSPLVSNIVTAEVTGLTATISFDTDEAATGLVNYGTSCAALVQSSEGIGMPTSHQIHLSGLLSSTQYFYAVKATDESENQTTDDNGGTCYSFTTDDQADYFTEDFASGNLDLANQSLTLFPDGSADSYAACQQSVPGFYTHPTGGTVLGLSDDDSFLVSLSGGQQVLLYGANYASFYVGSNGYLTFGSSDTGYSESLSTHFTLPRISGLFNDLNPSSGGQISWKQLADRVAVTYENGPEWGTSNSNSFQIEIFFDGTVRITHLAMAASDGLVGISAGAGVPADFAESDLT